MTFGTPFVTREDMRKRRLLNPAMFLKELSVQELKVVECRCGEKELTQDETARVLCIQKQTVKNHSTSIMRKLGVYSFNGTCRIYGQVKQFKVDGMKSYDV